MLVLTGYLGAGKTSLLNHILRQPGVRAGVIVNDFGDINIDAGLVTGQIDEPAAISGGCICCLEDAGGLDEALARLSAPRLALDVILIEASGLAEPVTLAHMVRFTAVEGVRLGGVVDVIDAVEHFRTVDTKPLPPLRYSVASLVVVNKLDRVPLSQRQYVLDHVRQRVGERNPKALIIGAIGGAVDPKLLYDVASSEEDETQLPLRQLLLDVKRADGTHHHDHEHAQAITASSDGRVDPGRVLDFLENPPAGVYRVKGTITTGQAASRGTSTINVVGTQLHVANAPPAAGSVLVAIGLSIDADTVRTRINEALSPITGTAPSAGHRRLQRYRRLSK